MSGSKLSVYEEREAGFIKGDKVVFLKNDGKLHVQNGLTGEIAADTGDSGSAGAYRHQDDHGELCLHRPFRTAGGVCCPWFKGY